MVTASLTDLTKIAGMLKFRVLASKPFLFECKSQEAVSSYQKLTMKVLCCTRKSVKLIRCHRKFRHPEKSSQVGWDRYCSCHFFIYRLVVNQIEPMGSRTGLGRYGGALPLKPYCKRRKAGWGLGTKLVVTLVAEKL